MHATLHSAAIAGAAARLVEVQVDLALGLPGFHLVGAPDHACIDARVRVLTALRNIVTVFDAGLQAAATAGKPVF